MGKVTAPNGTPDNLSVCIRFIRGIRVRLTRTRTRTRMRFLSSFSYSKKTTSGSCRTSPPAEGIYLNLSLNLNLSHPPSTPVLQPFP